MIKVPLRLIERVLKRVKDRIIIQYLERNKVLEVLKRGDIKEFAPQWEDLYYLHRIIRKRRPKCILEFGVGFSTIVMAHALYQNDTVGKKWNNNTTQEGKLYCVETNKNWIENTRLKLDKKLVPYVEFFHSKAKIDLYEGELCHFYELLPDVVPHFCYLDGPDPAEVEGSIRGLRFPKDKGPNRSVIAADILLYESTIKPSFLLVVDGRYQNVQFLKRHLKRKYRFTHDKTHNRYIFELLE